MPGRHLHVGEDARNTRQYAQNTMAKRSENTYSFRIRILPGISLVLVWLARVLREQHFSGVLHVVYSVCILCVFLTIQCILLYSVGVFCKSRNTGEYSENTYENTVQNTYSDRNVSLS